MIEAYTLSIDEYSRPAVYKDKKAIKLLLVRLILLNPGTFSSHPKMGVGLIKNWRYTDMDNIASLQLEISNQISTYLPILEGVEVTVEQNPEVDKEILIYITISDVLYSFKTENSNLVDL